MTGSVVGVPTATTGRFLVMAAAALGSASFAHDVSLASTGIERVPALLAGPAALTAATLLVYLALPAFTRQRLVAPDLRLDHCRRIVARVEELAAAAGLRRCPDVMFSTADGYAEVFGRYPRYCLAIHNKAQNAFECDPALFDGVVRHELAHVRLRDVEVSRLAAGMALAFIPVVVLPHLVVVGADDVGRYLSKDLWRLVALGVVVFLLFGSVMRTRELQADACAQLPERVWSCLSPGRFPWVHPSPGKRRTAAVDPWVVDRPSPLRAAATGVAAGIAVFPLDNAFTAVADDAASLGRSTIEGMAIGLVIAAVIGPAMWRLAAHRDRAGRWLWLEGLALGGGVLAGAELTMQKALALDIMDTERLWLAEVCFIALLAVLQAVLCRWIVVTAPVWQTSAPATRTTPEDLGSPGEQSRLSPLAPARDRRGGRRGAQGGDAGLRFRSRWHLLGAVVTVVLPTAAVWAFFLRTFAAITGYPQTLIDKVPGFFDHRVSSPLSLLDQLELFGIALHEAFVVQPMTMGPAYTTAMICICLPLALTPLRTAALWRRTPVIIMAGLGVFLILLPFLARLRSDAVSRSTQDGIVLAQVSRIMFLYWQLPLTLMGVAVAVAAAALAARLGSRAPALHAASATVLWGATIVLASISYSWPPARAAANADAAATMVTAPLLSLAVTAPLARLLKRPAITNSPSATRLRDQWRLITAITTAGVLINVASFYAAHRFVTVTPALPADEQATRCTTGRWHVYSDVHTFTIQGEKAQVVGGKGITWDFMPDGRYRRESHAAEYNVIWRARVWRLVHSGTTEGTWHVKDNKLILASVTHTDETRTLYLAPDKPMDSQPPSPTSTTRPEPRSLDCLRPHLVLGLAGGHEVLTAQSGRSQQ
ncbi:M48 family metalloprotease [Streptomyces cinnamoneus]|uniref:Peptidase M48 domain-containing protein n=1 Tax=Streptomyces cinnamoneus TaxID=53446 RepID=A0A918WHS3_STRCJ|nr:M48 family metalloprotease [Streptomyces cinnamoneus]GHC45027.1 hypothetical protein GCM10010507_20210 [Streptomyces cinnamoneus]